jgi:hypothetical protein
MELVEKSPLEEEGVFVSIYQLRYKYMYEISVTRPCPLLGLVEHRNLRLSGSNTKASAPPFKHLPGTMVN